METLPLSTRFETAALTIDDALEFAPLLAAYVQDMKRGAPRHPDLYYAETLLRDRTAEILGARLDGVLVGFAVFCDLPDAMSGMRVGQLEDLFVIHESRGRGIARALVEALARKGRSRDWLSLRWMVPEGSSMRTTFAETLGKKARLESFIVRIERGPSA
ncbi:GNAT family N-acetyltransferase [Kaistia defluvii]|uniref:GNAT family N-acetyltransferase n=1 Tax=Kaistia defluvii TaxID=410841 RepID=UPI00224F828E|nr:GNAT family N-acetyltransferase [Kaistia defluvii]MCX5518671.1 GNAT family N-acetyltransferase [Kaistia defluvii]